MNRVLCSAFAFALGPLLGAGCVGEDVFVDLGPRDMTVRPDLAPTELGAPNDFTVVPDLFGYTTAPDPYQPGTPRLSIGTFYEGGYSDSVPIDNKTAHVYIYPNGNTLMVAPDTMDKGEGYQSDDFTVAGGLGWFGAGVHWDAAHDLSMYKAMHIALKSQSGDMADVIVGMNSPMANPQTAKLSAAKYGYKNDGAWHYLTIPLGDFIAANPNPLNAQQVAAALVLVNAGVVKDGDLLKVDDVYFE